MTEVYVPSEVIKQTEIEAAIRHVEEITAPDVVRIRHEIGEDWSGQWTMFFASF